MKYLIAWLALLASPMLRASPAPIEQIEATARRHVAEEIGRLSLIEPVITLKAVALGRKPRSCAQPVSIEAVDTRHISRMTFRASCADHWQETYTVRGQITAMTVVAAAPLKAGQVIAGHDLRQERQLLAAPENALSDPAEAIGQASRRAVRAGQALDRRMLSAAILVRRGATVRIVANNAGISVTTAGQASETGKLGDLIEVRNAVTGKPVRARVTGENEVEPSDMSMPQRAD